MDHTGLGTLSRQGDRWTLRFTRRLAHPARECFVAGRDAAPGRWYPQETTRNGDLFVGWGSLPHISESSPSGKLLFNAEFPAGISTYRAYRLPWSPGV